MAAKVVCHNIGNMPLLCCMFASNIRAQKTYQLSKRTYGSKSSLLSSAHQLLLVHLVEEEEGEEGGSLKHVQTAK